MRYIIAIMTLLTVGLSAGTAHATNQAPFGNQVNTIKNYNRATSQIATSGVVGNAGVKALAEQGVKTIIDLRTEAEGIEDEKIAVESTGMRYINIPVTSAGISDRQLAIFSDMIEKAEKPVLIHCASGNRAGALWTAYRISKNIAPDIAFEEGRTAGMQPDMEAKIKATLKH